jgi:hypothetical protein
MWHGILVGKLTGKLHLERLTRRWEDDIKIALRKLCCEVGRRMNWLRFILNGGV